MTEIVHDYELRLLWTLTFQERRKDYEEVIADVRNFSRRLRANGLLMPRVIVPELSPSGRWHLHMAVPVYIPLRVMREVWGQGFVRAPDVAESSAPLALLKISEYLTKSFDATPAGCRRYITSAGLRPMVTRFTAPDEATALVIASRHMKSPPLRVGRYVTTFMGFFPTEHKRPA